MTTRIVYVNHSAIIGGGEISLLNLLRRVDRDKYFPVVVCPMKGPLTEELRRLDIPYFLIPFAFQRSPLAFASGLLELVKSSREIKLVHGNSAASLKMTAILGLLFGAKTIWHVRDLMWAERVSWKFRLLVTMLDCVVVNSEAVGRSWESSGIDDEKKRLVYNGVDIEQFRPNPPGEPIRDEFGISQKQEVVGVIGRLAVWKGHQTFLEALQMVRERYPHFRALVVGDTFELGAESDRRQLEIIRKRLGDRVSIPDRVLFKRRDLMQLAHELGLQEHVIFTGYRRDVPSVIAALDVLVLASWVEPFGRVLIEAMAMEKPVVATAGGGPMEIVDHETGILVPPLDAPAMATAIIQLFGNHDLRNSMGRKGRQRVKQSFSLDKHVQEIEALYDSLLHQQS